MKLVYKEDETGAQMLTDESGVHQVMMEWEKPYMEACIKTLDPSGRVLEIGFGLAYSATAICMNENVKEYTVIECSPVVWNKFDEFAAQMKEKRPDLKCSIVKGRWQDVLPTVGEFDAIFFDDYIDANAHGSANHWRFAEFMVATTSTHLSIEGRLCWFAGKGTFPVDSNEFITMESIDYDIDAPKHCRYTSASGYEIPVITKRCDCTAEQLKQFVMPWNLNKQTEEQRKVAESGRKSQEGKWMAMIEARNTLRPSFAIFDNYFNNAPDVTKHAVSLFKMGAECREPSGIVVQGTVSDSESGIFLSYISALTQRSYKLGHVEMSYVSLNALCQNHVRFTTDHEWTAIVLLGNCPTESGISILSWNGQFSTWQEVNAIGKDKTIEIFQNDPTKWLVTDKVCHRHNRMILIEPGQFYKFTQPFGKQFENSQLALIYKLGLL